MAAVFAQISKGSDYMSEEKGGATACFKLKKVTKEMKLAMKKEPSLKPKSVKKKKLAAAAKSKAKKFTAPPKKPSLAESKGTWWCEHYTENVAVENVSQKENVYIYDCSNCVITVPGKVKAISVDKCKKCYIVFDTVISTFSIVNSTGCKIVAQVKVPSVAIDKCDGINVILNESSVKEPPTLVTSKISEVNLTVPDPKGGKDADPIEMPLPEQYETTYSKGSISTSHIQHG